MLQTTDYTRATGAYTNTDSGNGIWWLRSPYINEGVVLVRLENGSNRQFGKEVGSNCYGVTPALWIDLNP